MTDIPWIVSLDDHVVEPPDVWTKRLPTKYRDIGPHVVMAPAGTPVLDGGGYIEAPGTDGPLVAWWHYEDHLYAQFARFEYTWRHHWREGDLLIWDNRCVQHAVVGDTAGQERSLHRTTIAGGTPT